MKTQFPWSLRRKIPKAIWLLFLVSSYRPSTAHPALLRCPVRPLLQKMCLFSTILYPGFNPFSWWFLFLIFHQSSKYSSNVAGLLCPVSPGVLYVFAFLQLLLIFSGRQKTQEKERQTVGGRKTGRFLCRIFQLWKRPLSVHILTLNFMPACTLSAHERMYLRVLHSRPNSCRF